MTAENPFATVREALGEGPGDSQRQAQRSRLLLSTANAPAPRLRGRWLFWPAAGVAFAVVLALLWPAPRTPQSAVPIGAEFSAPTSAPVTLTFADESHLTLSAGGRAQLEASDEKHVDVRLTSGRLDAKVTKHTGRVWRYLAGPYAVRVTGTELSVSWHPGLSALEVAVHEGAVEVTGPGLPSPQAVRAGQRLRRSAADAAAEARPSNGALVAKPELAAPEVAAVPSAHPASKPAAPHVEVEVVKPPPAAPDWRALLAQGNSKEALAAAESSGVLTRPELLASGELLRLADAARIAGHPRAENLLSRCVARGGEEGAEAAFLLGKLHQNRGEIAEAVGAFRDAMRLDPATYDEPASGRLLELLTQLNDPSVKDLAREYLRKHPDGPWAASAKKVVGER